MAACQRCGILSSSHACCGPCFPCCVAWLALPHLSLLLCLGRRSPLAVDPIPEDCLLCSAIRAALCPPSQAVRNCRAASVVTSGQLMDSTRARHLSAKTWVDSLVKLHTAPASIHPSQGLAGATRHFLPLNGDRTLLVVSFDTIRLEVSSSSFKGGSFALCCHAAAAPNLRRL